MIKQIITVCMLYIAVVSCKKETTASDIKPVNDSISKIKTQEDQYKPVDTACSSTHKTEDYIKSLQWYQKDIEKQVAQNSPEQNNQLYVDYTKIRSKYIECLSGNLGKILDEYINYYDPERNGYKFPENIKKVIADLKTADLKFVEVGEGYTEIWSVPKHYYSLFKNKVTPDYNTYLEQLSNESESLYSADAGITISWKELGDRVIFWEDFIKKYPNSSLVNKAKETYDDYLYDYLFGMDNTPTFEYSTGVLYDENKEEFKRIIKKYPKSNVTQKAKELMSLLEAKVPHEDIRQRLHIAKEY